MPSEKDSKKEKQRSHYGWEQEKIPEFYALSDEETAYFDVLDATVDSARPERRVRSRRAIDDEPSEPFVAAEMGPFYVSRPKFKDPIVNEPRPINTDYVPEWRSAEPVDAFSRRRSKSKKSPGDSESKIEDETARALDSIQKRKRKRLILIGAGLVGVVILVGVIYFGLIRPKDNYDAQMKIALASYKDEKWEAAESAFQRALEYKANDPDATIGLADTYIGWGKYDEAISLLTKMQNRNEQDTRTYNRLIPLYIEKKEDFVAANEQILKCFVLQIDPESSLIAAAPTLSPAAGKYSQEISIEISGPEGYSLFYTTDETIPNGKDVGLPYGEPLVYRNKTPLVVTIIGVDARGLYCWPTKAQYIVDINYIVDTTVSDLTGETAGDIISNLGALYYVGSRGDGYYYRDENTLYLFAFPSADFGKDADGNPNDPQKTPLPASSVCFAIELEAQQICVQIGDGIAVADLMSGINISDYYVNDNGNGTWALSYWSGGLLYTYELYSPDTIVADDMVRVTTG
ncbi:MAG: tetratricopeptide repeat protein [Clostridiales Family XIII bacterium]|jgi:tetratricopeptide (TPR) repeat protein|nr:tetratricopeptide repeat protein [Clostridiales Family XIII bacterium]